MMLLLLVAVPAVMAHGPESAETVGPHTHPVTEAVDADAAADPPVLAVPIHGAHPTTTIALKSGQSNVRGSMVAVIADDAATTDVTENEFTLLVTFSVDVTDDATQTSIAADFSDIADTDLAATSFTLAALNKDNTAVSTAPTLTIVRVNDGAATPAIVAAGKKQFEVTVAVTDLPSGTADANDETLTFRIRVNAGGVFALQTTEIGPDGINPVNVPGGGNLQSSILTLTLVKELPTITTPPVIDTAGPDITGFEVEKDGTNLKFTVTFDESLGRTGILPSHLMITGGTLVAGTTAAPNPKDTTAASAADNAAHTYEILVTPTGDLDETEVTVKIIDGTVADLEGNHYREPDTNVMMGRYDTVNPTVNAVARGPAAPVPAGPVKLQITFSEKLGSADGQGFENADIDRTNSNVLLTRTEPVMAATQPTDGTEVWELTVTPVPADAAQVVIVIKESSIADVKGNELEQDTIVTWTRPTLAGDTTAPVVTITGPDYIDSVSGGMVTITATDNVAVTNAVMDAEITVPNTVKGNIANNMIHVSLHKTGDHVDLTTITVNVAAGAAMDAAGNGSLAVSKTFNVGPIFTVPAGAGTSNPGYLVITKTTGMTHTYLSDQPTLHNTPENQNPPIPAANLNVSHWGNIPDLERLFNTTSGNGGTLNIKAAATHPTEGTGSGTGNVRITEVMWAIDEYKRGATNDAEAAEQWVEIENPNAHAVKVILYARTGRDSAIHTNDGQIDRIGNAYNGGPGNPVWAVPGSNGNSYTGVDFKSMWRRYNENNRGKGYANGTASGAWSESSNIYLTSATENPNDGALYNHRGTPGRLQSVKLPLPNTKSDITKVPSSPFVINEVANRDSGNAKYEWIEIKNVSSGEANLRNYLISMVTATGTDTVLLELDNRDYKVPAGDVLLLLATDPRYDDDHPIAVGYNVDVNANDQVDGLGLIVPDSNRKPPRQKVTAFKNGGLPDDGNFVLILRRPDNYEGHRSGQHGGKGVAETGEADVDKIVDIAGHHEGLNKSNYPATTPANLNNTTLWPLVNFTNDLRPHRGHGDWNHRRHNRFYENRVRYRQHVKTFAKNDADGTVKHKDNTNVNRGGTGTTHKNEDVGHYAFRDAIYTGLGYKRTARAPSIYNGTPGYDGNSVGNTGVVKATAAAAEVKISEIMTSTGPNADRAVYPQWIELYNSSPVNAVNLRNWKLRFEMLDADGNPMDSLMDLHFNSSRSVKTIQPQQTVLIVASRAQANSDSRAGTDVYNENRVFNVQRDVGLGKFGANTRYQFFNPKAFSIALLDKDNKVVDRIGNLDGDSRTSDTNTWDFPVGVAEDGNRTSFIRIYDDGVARTGANDAASNVMPIFGTGDKKVKGNDGIDAKWSWIPAVNTKREFKVTIKSTWYGNEDDYGTPNNRPGMVLPVELSFFRPTLEDGVVTIRWTTESELDNAGFNIYRSETRNGEYKQVNAEMIQGAGTTGERSSYKWVDQTAKPGVVYYYQIEDVSFAGERQALAITKLKGLISSENKLTTTWSELKASQ